MRLLGSAPKIAPQPFFGCTLWSLLVPLPFLKAAVQFWDALLQDPLAFRKPFCRANLFVDALLQDLLSCPRLAAWPSSFFSGQCATQCHPLHPCGMRGLHLPIPQALHQAWPWPWTSLPSHLCACHYWCLASQARPLRGACQTLQGKTWIVELIYCQIIVVIIFHGSFFCQQGNWN